MRNSRFNLFTKKLLWIVGLFIVIIFTSCSHAEDVFEEKDETESDSNLKEELIEYKDGVVLLNELSIDSVQIVSDENIKVYTKENLESNQYIGKIIVYSNDFSSKNLFIGKVKDMNKTTDYVSFETEIPLMDEVFEELCLQPELNSENATIEFTPDPSDNVTYSGIVSNDVWNYIQPVNVDSIGTESRINGLSSRDFVTPIDLTLKFESDDKNIFSGNIYYRIKGNIKINKDYSYEMYAHQIIGLEGSLEMASFGKDREYVPFLKIKNGLTLYNNKLVGIRVKPSVNFFYSGGISIEAALKYELMNVDSYFAFEEGNFTNKALDNKRDWFFRVKSLKSQGSLGFSLNSDFYAFIFSENFFSGGVKTVAGIEMAGEKNVGIQFPDIANFDFQVGVIPFLELTPFAVVRLPDLKRLEGFTMTISSERFTADLIPSIHDMNYEKANKQLHYNANVGSFENSFIEAPECGIAIFEKGEGTPIEHGALKQNSKETRSSDLSFNISNDVAYEIAPYVKTYSDGYVYGERMKIAGDINDFLMKLYKDLNGESWTRNDNWFSDKPVYEWYGIEYFSDNDLCLNLSNNNLSGNFILDLAEIDFNLEINLSGEDIDSIEIKNDNDNLFISGLDAKNIRYNNFKKEIHIGETSFLEKLEIKKCSDDIYIHENQSLNTINIEDCELSGSGVDISKNDKLTDVVIKSTNIEAKSITDDISIRENQSLNTINIEDCELSGSGVDISKNDKLTDVVIKSTNIEAKSITDDISIRENQSLNTIKIEGYELNHFFQYNNKSLFSIKFIDCIFNEKYLDFSDSKNTKELEFNNCISNGIVISSNPDINSITFDGCKFLECLYIIYNDELTDLNIINCYLNFSIQNNRKLYNVKLENSTINKKSDFYNCPILQQIHKSMETQFDKIQHKARYDYWSEKLYDESGNIIGEQRYYKDNNIGWWFANEPERGYHFEQDKP